MVFDLTITLRTYQINPLQVRFSIELFNNERDCYCRILQKAAIRLSLVAGFCNKRRKLKYLALKIIIIQYSVIAKGLKAKQSCLYNWI